jgi:hypothetical protein
MGQRVYAVATSPEARAAFGETWQKERVEALGNRMLQKAELRDTTDEIADPDNPKLGLYMLEDLVGAQLAEAAYGYDLTGRKLEGELLDGGERTQTMLFGVAGVTGTGAALLAPVAEAGGLSFRLGPGAGAVAPAGAAGREPVAGAAVAEQEAAATADAGVAPNRAVMFNQGVRGSEAASEGLLDAVGARRTVQIATEGSEEMRYLDYMGANANVGGPNMTDILLRPNPTKIEVMEEFLHGTQFKAGIIDRLGLSGAEVQVKEFMLNHQRLLRLSEQDAAVLRQLLGR